MSKHPVPSGLKAAFREEARRIIRADRATRRTGAPQNTIMVIAGALERAFKLGRDNPDALGSPDRSWEEIPPRARDTLIDLGFSARLGDPTQPARPVRLVSLINGAGKLRWVREQDPASSRTFVSGAIDPLVRKGLLIAPPGAPEILELSLAGLAAYDGYWARREAEDPTLPLEGMRPTKQGW